MRPAWGNYETYEESGRGLREALVKLREDCKGKERRPHGESTSSDRESEGTSAEDSV